MPVERFWLRGETMAFLFFPTNFLQAAREASEDLDTDRAAAGSFSGLVRLDRPLSSDRSAFRVAGGVWLDDRRTVGLEAGYTRINRGTIGVTIFPNDLSLADARQISLPVFDPVLNRLAAVPLSLSAVAAGNVRFEFGERNYHDFQLFGRLQLFQGEWSRFDALAGYRRFTFEDSFRMQTNVTTRLPPFLPGTRLTSTDDASARNTHEGVTFGFDWEIDCGQWRLSARPKASVMYAESSVVRSASTIVTLTNGVIRVIPEGAYTLAEDTGAFEDAEWAVVPELDLQISRTLGRNWRVFAGTSLLYFPNLARASNQITLGIPASRLPAGVPAEIVAQKVPPVRDPVLLSTISLGVEFRY